MAEDKIRLGGMALANGVLVHGPTAWACAIRTDDGRLKVASEPKRFRASEIGQPLLRGPARLLEALAVIPEVRRALPEAKLPFQRPAVLGAMVASATVVKLTRESARLTPAALSPPSTGRTVLYRISPSSRSSSKLPLASP